MKNVLVNKTLLLIFMLTMMSMARAQDVIIPDANFKAALLAHDPIIDTNGDDEIQVSEAEAFTGTLNVALKNITDATGLEAFINITRLSIERNTSLSSLDVSANTKLTYLYAISLNLSTIDISQNTLLDTLSIAGNSLSTIDISNNINLKYLWAGANSLTSMDLSTNTALEFLRIEGNNISSFNPPAFLNSQLKVLGYGDNPFANTFDFTIFPNLEELYCFSSGLTSLDVSSLSNLKSLWAFDNPISTIDLSNNVALEVISIGATWIENLDLSNNNNLTSVVVAGSPSFTTESRTETINLANGNNEAMTALILSGSPLLSCVKVDDPANPFPNLETAIFDDSKFSSFCVPGALNFIDPAFGAALFSHEPAIDVNDDGVITKIEAANFIAPLDLSSSGIRNAKEISNFTNLTSLDLSGNFILNLDLSQNTALTDLNLLNTNMRVLSLDNGNNTAISSLVIPGNTLTCVTVDDPAYSTANWSSFPSTSGVSYSTDCEVVLYPTFKTQLINDGYDTSGDGEIQVSEAEAVTGELDYRNANLIFVSGLEAFVNITALDLGSNSGSGLSALDVTQNTNLTQLQLFRNSIPSLDLSCNPSLSFLVLSFSSSNQFTNLDLTSNTSLTTLLASISNFEEIDLSNSKSLRSLTVNGNKLTELDLSNVKELVGFRVNDNNLQSIDLRNVNLDNMNPAAFNALNNPDLTCISIDDPVFAQANYTNVDAGLQFDVDCADFPIQFADANLETALLTYSPAIDLNGDGDIRPSEAAAFTGVLNLAGLSIATAEELQYFTGATGLDISNNNLTLLNIRNGNNINFTVFDARGNSGLGCIKVDQAFYSTQNWTNIDAGASFSAYCETDETVYIPDEFWKNRIIAQGVDTDQDEEISYAEALAFTGKLVTGFDRVADVTGLEAFENLTELEIWTSAVINELDVTANTQLTRFVYTQTAERVTSLDLSNNQMLEYIQIGGVPIASIDLTNFSNLNSFICNSCGLSSLDASQNTSLTLLSLSNNEISEIDLSNNTLLTQLYLGRNPLSTIDLTALSELTDLSLGGTFTSIDLSNQAKLEQVEIDFPQFQSIDLSNNPLLEYVNIAGGEDEDDNLIKGKLEEITLPDDPARLYNLGLQNNIIRSIDISNVRENPEGPGGSVVSLYGNDLHELNIGLVRNLDITDNPNLTCAKTTDVAYAEANYSFDIGLTFDPNCFSSENDILSFEIAGSLEITFMEDQFISILMPAGTDRSSLTPTITVSEGASIDPGSGISQDFTSRFTYTVTAEDGTTQQWDVDVNEKTAEPADITLSSNTVDENSVPGTIVGELSAVDENFSETFTFFVVAELESDDWQSFDISGNNLITTDFISLDFETKNEFTFDISVQDDDGDIFEKEFTLTLNDINDVPTGITLDNNSIDESNPIGTVVGVFTTVDEDAGQSHTYTLVSGPADAHNASFTIEGNQLLTAEVFDYETQGLYSIRIRTDDGNGGIFESGFGLSVNDLPASITSLDLSNQSINENESVGTVIGAFTTTGEDLSGNFTYSLVSGDGDDDNALFTISNDQLLSSESFDFETKSSLSIRVMTDEGALTREEIFTITVENVFEAPTDLTLSKNSIAENNSENDVIGTLTTSDEDADESFTYELVSGDGDTDNASFNINGNELRATDVFDFETKSSFSVRIETNDGNGGTYQEALTISITNVNESISITNPIADQSFEEGFASATIDLTNVFVDADGDDLTFTIISSDENVVTASNSELTLTISEVGTGTATITVSANDGSGVTTSDEFQVTVTETPLGFEDEVAIEVYPNPTIDFINVNADETVEVLLINMKGQTLRSASGLNVKLDVIELSSGMYILKISNKESSSTRRIIKAN